MVFKGKKNTREIRDCIEDFQKTLEKETGNQQLQFTAEIWTTGENSPTPAKEEIFQILTNNKLPFLDIKTSWSPERDLQFGVFRKKGKQFK